MRLNTCFVFIRASMDYCVFIFKLKYATKMEKNARRQTANGKNGDTRNPCLSKKSNDKFPLCVYKNYCSHQQTQWKGNFYSFGSISSYFFSIKEMQTEPAHIWNNWIKIIHHEVELKMNPLISFISMSDHIEIDENYFANENFVKRKIGIWNYHKSTNNIIQYGFGWNETITFLNWENWNREQKIFQNSRHAI